MPLSAAEIVDKVFRDTDRDGCFASADLQKQSYLKWMSSDVPVGYTTLAAIMNRACPLTENREYPYHRVADALVQKLRKAGLIETKAKKWILTAEGHKVIAYLSDQPEPAPDF